MVLTASALVAAKGRLDAEPAADLAAATSLSDARVRALRAGVEVLLLLLERYRLDRLHVSFEGLRHGMLLSYLACGDHWWR